MANHTRLQGRVFGPIRAAAHRPVPRRSWWLRGSAAATFCAFCALIRQFRHLAEIRSSTRAIHIIIRGPTPSTAHSRLTCTPHRSTKTNQKWPSSLSPSRRPGRRLRVPGQQAASKVVVMGDIGVDPGPITPSGFMFEDTEASPAAAPARSSTAASP